MPSPRCAGTPRCSSTTCSATPIRRTPPPAPPPRAWGPAERRGGTLALNFRDAQGRLIDHRIVEELANRRRISLRTGCFCNPGAGELALGLTRDERVSCFRHTADIMTYEDFRHCIHHEGTGAVRVSLGMVSSFADAEAFLRLAEDFLED